VAVLIKKDTPITFKLTSDGTKSTTNLTVKAGASSQEAVIVEGFKVAGTGLSKVNATTVEDWLNAFPSNAVSFNVKRNTTGTTYSFSILLKGLSDGNYYLYVAAWNSSNSSQRVVAFNWTSVKITTVAPAPPPSGGGGGAAPPSIPPPPTPTPTPTPTPEEEVVYSEVVTIEENVEVSLEIPQEKAEEIGVLSLTITVQDSMNLEVMISKLESLPPEVPEPPAGKVYRYVEITFRNNDTGEEVEPSGYIEFKVPKSWVEESGHDPENVVLMKYRDGWIELKTEKTGEDENSYYYRAETGSFSVFAIAVKAVTPAVTPTPAKTSAIVTPTPTYTPAVTPAKTPTPTPEETPAPPEKPSLWKSPWIWLAIVLAAIVVIVTYWSMRKE